MDKRDRFISDLRHEAKALGLEFRVERSRGKGGHVLVYAGDRFTTLPGRDIDPKTASKIRKTLNLAPDKN